MKQVLTVNAGFAQLLEFITPSLKPFPVWPGDMANLLAYEDRVVSAIDRKLHSWTGGLDTDEIDRLATNLYSDVALFCPEFIGVFTGTTDPNDIPQEAYQRFPIQKIYSRWARFRNWAWRLDQFDEEFEVYGSLSRPLPQTYAIASGLKMDSSLVTVLYPPSLGDGFIVYSTTTLVSNILKCKNFPICYTSRGKEAMHPWVAMLYETLELVRQRSVRWLPPAGTREAAIKFVTKAFVQDRTEFVWKPRELYRFSQEGTPNSWFGQLAEWARLESTSRFGPADSNILRNRIIVGLVGYCNSRFHGGMLLDSTDAWAEVVANHIMVHRLPKGPPSEQDTVNDDGWVAKVDKVILDERRQLADQDNPDNVTGDED